MTSIQKLQGSLLAITTLWKRELVRFFRQKGRVVGALGTPVGFWILIGSGFGKSFRMPISTHANEINYLEYFFPGTITLIILFTSIFSTISLIEDRREGFPSFGSSCPCFTTNYCDRENIRRDHFSILSSTCLCIACTSNRNTAKWETIRFNARGPLFNCFCLNCPWVCYRMEVRVHSRISCCNESCFVSDVVAFWCPVSHYRCLQLVGLGNET